MSDPQNEARRKADEAQKAALLANRFALMERKLNSLGHLGGVILGAGVGFAVYYGTVGSVGMLLATICGAVIAITIAKSVELFFR